MTTFEAFLLILLTINVAVGIFVAFRFISAKSAFRDLQVVYFTETRTKDGFIKKESLVQIKGQILIRGLPIGHPFVMIEQVSEEVDKERVNQILEEYAKPLLSLGLNVATKKLT